jgi:sodium-coupled neutral amino acid transporter 11
MSRIDRGVLADGAALSGLPYAIREAGFVTGLVLLVGLGFITDWTIRMYACGLVITAEIPALWRLSASYFLLCRIVVNAKMTGKTSYSDIMEACFGYKGRAAVAFIQFAMAFGGMCAFAVILGDTIPRKGSVILTCFSPAC